MRLVAGRLRFDAHLACVEIILDGVGVAHLIVLILRVAVYLPEQAVGGHDPEVVHPHRAVIGGLHFAVADVAAARERQPITQRNFSAAQQHGSHAKRGVIPRAPQIK